MKHKLLYVLPLLALLATACLKKSNTGPTTVLTPSGTYSGTFKYFHRHTNTVPYDSAKASIVLKMLTTNNTYSVTGDTTTIHAGSQGSFTMASPYIGFVDQTFPKTGIPVKNHLQGYYLYYYDGTVFQMLAYSSDTLSVEYDLKKTGN